MVKSKTAFSIFSIIFCSLMCLSLFVGCANRKYDVTMKIRNNLGDEWVFTPDIERLSCEYDYTGEEMFFYIDSYNLAKHPRWGREWFSPSGDGANVFTGRYLFTATDGTQSEPRSVLERGEYIFSCIAHATSDLWNFRSVQLTIVIK